MAVATSQIRSLPYNDDSKPRATPARQFGELYSILQDREFALSREAIVASRKELKKEGKGNKPNASESLESEDSERLWESGAIGEGDPETLQNSVCLMLCMHMSKLKFRDSLAKKHQMERLTWSSTRETTLC